MVFVAAYMCISRFFTFLGNHCEKLVVSTYMKSDNSHTTDNSPSDYLIGIKWYLSWHTCVWVFFSTFLGDHCQKLVVSTYLKSKNSHTMDNSPSDYLIGIKWYSSRHILVLVVFLLSWVTTARIWWSPLIWSLTIHIPRIIVPVTF